MNKNVIPISHLGGDGAHFMGYLMSYGISNFNMIHSSIPHDNNNNYMFVHDTYNGLEKSDGTTPNIEYYKKDKRIKRMKEEMMKMDDDDG